MTIQDTFEISTRGRGMTEITDEVAGIVRAAKIKLGIAHVFAQHTSCSVIITENADPTVRGDLAMLGDRLAARRKDCLAKLQESLRIAPQEANRQIAEWESKNPDLFAETAEQIKPYPGIAKQ